MKKKILVDGNYPSQTRIVLLDQSNKIEELEYESANLSQIKSNIYLAKIVRIEPGLQAVFIDYGSEKNGFLPFSEINPDYYNIKNEKTLPDTENFQTISLEEVSFDENLNKTENIILSTTDLDLDISTIEKFIDEDIQSQLNESAGDSELDEISSEASSAQKPINLMDLLKKGQYLLVQAQKEERGNKGASFTTNISLAGKYNVLLPTKKDNSGISRRISSVSERRRLKEIVRIITESTKNPSPSIIVRTAGFGRSAEEIYKDYEYLVRLWNQIKKIAQKSQAPSFIHIEDGIINKTIRDYYDSKVGAIIVQGNEAYEIAKDFMSDILPDDISKLTLYEDQLPIFTKFGIESQISELYQQIVYLPSGGYIVINPTEALTSIDVNSGKSTQEKNIEETALKTNLEAAKEIARCLKLRDISGLIVIDFIDMSEPRNRKIIERSLKEYFARDRARIQIGSISNFGLLEMSRQRLRSTFLEVHSKICSNCNGKGLVRSDEANSMVILRTIENEIYETKADIINIYSSQNAIIYLLNHKRMEIALIEDKFGVKLNFLIDSKESSDGFSIEQVTLPSYSSNHSDFHTQRSPESNNNSSNKQKNINNFNANNSANKDNKSPNFKKNKSRKKLKDTDQKQVQNEVKNISSNSDSADKAQNNDSNIAVKDVENKQPQNQNKPTQNITHQNQKKSSEENVAPAKKDDNITIENNAAQNSSSNDKKINDISDSNSTKDLVNTNSEIKSPSKKNNQRRRMIQKNKKNKEPSPEKTMVEPQ